MNNQAVTIETVHAEKVEKLKARIQELEQKLEQAGSSEDVDVVKLNDRGVFEMNFDSLRVQIRFLRQLQRALGAGQTESAQ